MLGLKVDPGSEYVEGSWCRVCTGRDQSCMNLSASNFSATQNFVVELRFRGCSAINLTLAILLESENCLKTASLRAGRVWQGEIQEQAVKKKYCSVGNWVKCMPGQRINARLTHHFLDLL